MREQKRIAIYGGTFDPVHRGHLEVAKQTVELFGLSELLFVPARQAPHKLERKATAPLHRYAMLALATQASPKLMISSFELDAPDRRYTIDTLEYFRSYYGDEAEIFFVMGADSWVEITTWREWKRLLHAASHIVVTRPGFEVKLDPSGPQVDVQTVDVRGWDASRLSNLLGKGTTPRVYISDAAMVDVSATAIRAAAREEPEEILDQLVPRPVADYIRKYRLYKNSNET